MLRILRHEPVDRIGVYEHFWGDTYNAWRAEGHIPNGESFDDHFGFDMSECWPLNMVADLDFKQQVVAEDEDTITFLDGNGAILRRHKFHDTTPEHVDFTVKEREDWEKIKPLLLEPNPRRINFEAYRNAKKPPQTPDGSLCGAASTSLSACIRCAATKICWWAWPWTRIGCGIWPKPTRT